MVRIVAANVTVTAASVATAGAGAQKRHSAPTVMSVLALPPLYNGCSNSARKRQGDYGGSQAYDPIPLATLVKPRHMVNIAAICRVQNGPNKKRDYGVGENYPYYNAEENPYNCPSLHTKSHSCRYPHSHSMNASCRVYIHMVKACMPRHGNVATPSGVICT